MAFTLRTPLAPEHGSLANQLVRQLREAIASQTLKPGDRLPASRRLAKELGIARGTVAPAQTIRQLAKLRSLQEYAPNTPMQIALARFISQGYFEAHVHRTKRIYASKRVALEEWVAGQDWNATVTGLASGLHAVLQLGDNLNATKLAQQAATQGIQILPLSRYAVAKPPSDNALVVGYAQPSLEQLLQGIETLTTLSKSLKFSRPTPSTRRKSRT